MIQSTSAAHAKAYYSEALLKTDYYLNDQELGGAFRGRLAARLGITGPATRDAFFALCENTNPHTGTSLTQRTRQERTTGYDINFHCPKSVSLVHALSKDDHILEAFRSTVADTMADIEADSKTRVRKDKTYEDRNTGNLLWVDFIHQTARPVDGSQPDPHLHTHCYVFNATYDETEGCVKAGQFRDIKRDMPYYQAMFHKRLSDKLIDLGYQVERTKKSFELVGVPRRAIELFSKRTDEIGKTAKEKGITDAKALDELGARTRAKKQKGLGMDALKAEWRKQLRDLGEPGEDDASPLRHSPAPDKEIALPSAEACLDFAMRHSFEKAAVLPARRILATAYTEAIGAPEATIKDIDRHLNADAAIIHGEEGGRHVCTTKDILREEKEMVALAQAGRGTFAPLYAQAPKTELAGQQAEAVGHLLTTNNQVSIIRGAAGTGKTTLMREAVHLMNSAGKRVTVVAPTSTAARDVLRSEGFAKAETVAALLVNKSLQDSLKDQVIWVDEAGMLGNRDMLDLLTLARKQNARLVLGGDTRQHASVARGDALRVLNKIGRIETAEVSKIYRQKDARYREAVESLSAGKIKAGFEQLDAMDAITEVDPKKPNEQLVGDYVGAVKAGKEVLLIAPTNAHRQTLTEEIRSALRKEGLLGKKEISTEKLENRYLSEAQKEDWKTYRPDQVIQFVQNTAGIQRGSRWKVKEASETGVSLTNSWGKTAALLLSRAQCFDVLESSTIKLSKGDKVKITRNGFDRENIRLTNGQLLDVVSVKKDGSLFLRNPASKHVYQLNKDFGHIDHALCLTSYASQGKTVDEVMIAQPAATFPGVNAKQFYVSVSRARNGVRIYTDDKEELLGYASRSGDRTAALEVSPSDKRHNDHINHLQRDEYNAVDKQPQAARQELDKDIHPSHVTEIDRDYEPGI